MARLVCLSISCGSELWGGGLSTADAMLGILSTLTSSLALLRSTLCIEGLPKLSCACVCVRVCVCVCVCEWVGGWGGGEGGREESQVASYSHLQYLVYITAVVTRCSLVPRPFPASVFDHLR